MKKNKTKPSKKAKKGELVVRRGAKPKRQIKASVFEDYFSTVENLRLMSVELGVNPGNADITDMKITRILVEGSDKDIGFLIGDEKFVLVEAQSTDPTNLPLRMWGYAFDVALAYVKQKDENGSRIYNEYGAKKINLPWFEMFAVYPFDEDDSSNGPDHYDLELFPYYRPRGTQTGIQVIRSVPGNGPLAQYIRFCQVVKRVWKKYNEMNEATFAELYDYCVEHHIMEDYLKSRWNEVERILTSSYAEEMKQLAARNEGIAKGRSEGFAEGKAEGIAQGAFSQKRKIALMMLRKHMDDLDIAEMTDLSIDEIKELKKQLN